MKPFNFKLFTIVLCTMCWFIHFSLCILYLIIKIKCAVFLNLFGSNCHCLDNECTKSPFWNKSDHQKRYILFLNFQILSVRWMLNSKYMIENIDGETLKDFIGPARNENWNIIMSSNFVNFIQKTYFFHHVWVL